MPSVCLLVAFFGFVTNYTTDVFSAAGLAQHYERSIFRFRVLGRWMLLELSALLERLPITYPVPRALTLMDPVASGATYWAYVLQHILCVGAGCSVLLCVLRRRQAERERGEPELLVAAIGAGFALSTYVVTPYDAPFFTCLCVAIALTLQVPPGRAWLPLGLVTVVASSIRETGYFIPAFFFAVHHQEMLRRGPARRTFVLVGAAWVLTYAGLRVAFGLQNSVYYAVQWSSNGRWTSVAGFTLLLGLLPLLLHGARNRHACLWYLAASTPYVLFIAVFAEPWEIRLWVPVIAPLLVLRVVNLGPVGRPHEARL